MRSTRDLELRSQALPDDFNEQFFKELIQEMKCDVVTVNQVDNSKIQPYFTDSESKNVNHNANTEKFA